MTELSKKKDIEEGTKEENGQANAKTSVQTSDTGDSISSGARIRVLATANPAFLSLRDEIDSGDEEIRKAQLCCGSCCDFVRACLVVDCIYVMVLLFLNAKMWLFNDLFNFQGVGRIEMDDSEDIQLGGYDDDVYFKDEGMECYFCLTAIQAIVGMAFGLIGAIGAWRFQKYMVLITGIWYLIDAIWYCVLQNYISAFWILGYSYPHIGLFLALRSGKITPENYTTTEKYCCGRDRVKD